MAATHGDLCHKFQAATSYEGRDIFGLHVSKNFSFGLYIWSEIKFTQLLNIIIV